MENLSISDVIKLQKIGVLPIKESYKALTRKLKDFNFVEELIDKFTLDYINKSFANGDFITLDKANVIDDPAPRQANITSEYFYEKDEIEIDIKGQNFLNPCGQHDNSQYE